VRRTAFTLGGSHSHSGIKSEHRDRQKSNRAEGLFLGVGTLSDKKAEPDMDDEWGFAIENTVV